MNKTKIEWCDYTVNPVVGCRFKCEYCYARKLNDRFKFVDDFHKPQFFPERLKQLNKKKPANIFMTSMSDLADWELEWWEQTKMAMLKNPQHNYLFLTKRPSDISEYLMSGKNIWYGATVTKNKFIDELFIVAGKHYQKTEEDINIFLSVEPLLEEISFFCFNSYEWVIIGAETGNRSNKVIPKKAWVDLIDWSFRSVWGVPIFMKDSLIPIMGEENMLRQFPKGLKK